MVNEMFRGDVYEAVLDPTKSSEQSGRRPVVIVSRDSINRNAAVVVVVPITGKENRSILYPSNAEIRAGDGGLHKDSVALCEQIRSISKARLTKALGRLSNSTVMKIDAALKIALDLS
jgi:mRNA interferase MazF